MLLLGCEQRSSPESSGALKPADPADSVHRSVAPVQRIVSLAPGITELIYAVGAEQSLLATVEYADYPAAAKKISRVGDAFRVDIEKLLALKPDLVLTWTSGTPSTTVEQIRALGLRVESMEVKHLSEVSDSLIRIGELTGMQVNARRAASEFESGISTLRLRYRDRMALSVFVEVNSQPLYTVSGQHVLSEVLQVCGGRNVLAGLNQLAPIVSTEAVLQANPDVIISTEGTLRQLQQEWQAWPQLTAVKQRHLYVVSSDTATRATPRLLQGTKEVCEALDRARGLL